MDILLPKPQCRFTDFPQELLEAVIEHLADDKDALSACSQICRRFLPRSQELLFGLWKPKRDSGVKIIRSMMQLCRVLEVSPHIGAYIHKFPIFLGALKNDTNSTAKHINQHPRGALPFVTYILPLLPQIQILSLEPLCLFHEACFQSLDDFPADLRSALTTLLCGAIIKRVIISSIKHIDLEIFRETKRIQCLEFYNTTLFTLNPMISNLKLSNPLSTNNNTHQLLLRKCRVETIVGDFYPVRCLARFVDYSLDSSISAIDLSSLSNLRISDPTNKPGSNPISRLFQYCAPSLVALELIYDQEYTDSSWECPNLSPLLTLTTLVLDFSICSGSENHDVRWEQALRLLFTLSQQTPLSRLTLNFYVGYYRSDDVGAEIKAYDWNFLDDRFLVLRREKLSHLKELNVIYSGSPSAPQLHLAYETLLTKTRETKVAMNFRCEKRNQFEY